MLMRSLSRMVASALLLVVVQWPAQAADSPLAVVPASSAIVVQVNGIEKAKDRLSKMLDSAIPDMAKQLVGKMDEQIKEALSGRSTKDIVPDGHVFVIVPDFTTLSQQPPQLSIAVPVKSYEDFKKSFLKEGEVKSLKKEDGFEAVQMEGKDEPAGLIDRKSYVVVCANTSLAKDFLKNSKGLDTALSEDVKKSFTGSDVAIYVNMALVNETYGQQLAGFKQLIDLVIQQGGAAQGLDKKQMEMVKDVLKGILQVVSDSVGAVIALDFRPEGANLRLQAQFNPKSSTSDFLKDLKPSSLGELDKLPVGQMGYTGMAIDEKIMKAFASLMEDFSAEDADEDAKKVIEKAMEDLKAAGMQGQYGTTSFPAMGLQVGYYKDPNAAVAATTKMIKALTKTGSFQNVPLKDKPEMKENAETVGNFKFTMTKMKFDLEKALESTPEASREVTKAMMEKMLGGEELSTWYGTDGKVVLTVNAKDWKSAKALVDDFVSGTKTLAKDEAFVLTRKNMPADNTMLMIFDTGKTIFQLYEIGKDIAQGVPGFPGQLPEIKAPGGKPNYFGVSVVLKKEHGSLDLFVPTTGVAQIRKMFGGLLDD